MYRTCGAGPTAPLEEHRGRGPHFFHRLPAERTPLVRHRCRNVRRHGPALTTPVSVRQPKSPYSSNVMSLFPRTPCCLMKFSVEPVSFLSFFSTNFMWSSCSSLRLFMPSFLRLDSCSERVRPNFVFPLMIKYIPILSTQSGREGEWSPSQPLSYNLKW